ncbi:MAG: hypothetical protein IK125_08090 [Lachnospiraceae bacterium]|nr:hypothetical protein [Lachnospiraceae bacterium]
MKDEQLVWNLSKLREQKAIEEPPRIAGRFFCWKATADNLLDIIGRKW